MDCNSAREVWLTLKNTYEPLSMGRFAALMDEFLDSRFDPETKSMTKYVARVTQAAKALLTVDFQVPDIVIAYALLRRLLDEYDSLAQGLYRTPKSEFTSSTVSHALISEAGRRQQKERDRGLMENTLAIGGVKKKIRQGKDKNPKTCFNCNKPVHFAKDCYAKKNSKGQNNQRNINKGQNNQRNTNKGHNNVTNTNKDQNNKEKERAF